VKNIEGANTVEFLEKFKPNVQSVSPSWAFSYGLFKKGQAHYVFSYLTSLAFHWGHEKNREYKAVSFPEGHPVQVEFAAVPSTCAECELGHDFVAAMLTPEAQKIIMEKNFMLPAFKGPEQGTVFGELPVLKARNMQHLVTREFDDWDKVFKH
jgi:thiamine transport system substrate-binding protein